MGEYIKPSSRRRPLAMATEEPLNYNFTPLKQKVEGREHLSYELVIRQQPQQARTCGQGEKTDRRPVDPPPIVRLEVRDHSIAGGEARSANAKLSQSPYYFMYVSLCTADGKEELYVQASNNRSYVTGSVVSSLHHLRDPQEGDSGSFFVFPDINVRVEGTFTFRMTLYEMVDMKVYHCASVQTDPFTVYSAKRFPGMKSSTELSKAFADSGVRIRIRSTGKASGQDKNLPRQPVEGVPNAKRQRSESAATLRDRELGRIAPPGHPLGEPGPSVYWQAPPPPYALPPRQAAFAAPSQHTPQGSFGPPLEPAQHHSHPARRERWSYSGERYLDPSGRIGAQAGQRPAEPADRPYSYASPRQGHPMPGLSTHRAPAHPASTASGPYPHNPHPGSIPEHRRLPPSLPAEQYAQRPPVGPPHVHPQHDRHPPPPHDDYYRSYPSTVDRNDPRLQAQHSFSHGGPAGYAGPGVSDHAVETYGGASGVAEGRRSQIDGRYEIAPYGSDFEDRSQLFAGGPSAFRYSPQYGDSYGAGSVAAASDYDPGDRRASYDRPSTRPDSHGSYAPPNSARSWSQQGQPVSSDFWPVSAGGDPNAGYGPYSPGSAGTSAGPGQLPSSRPAGSEFTGASWYGREREMPAGGVPYHSQERDRPHAGPQADPRIPPRRQSAHVDSHQYAPGFSDPRRAPQMAPHPSRRPSFPQPDESSPYPGGFSHPPSSWTSGSLRASVSSSHTSRQSSSTHHSPSTTRGDGQWTTLPPDRSRSGHLEAEDRRYSQ